MEESCRICGWCKQPLISGLFFEVCIRDIHMSQLNVIYSQVFSRRLLNGRALDQDASRDLSLPRGPVQGADEKCHHHEDGFGR